MKLLNIMTSPWAIVPQKLQEIREVYTTHMRGEKIKLSDLKKPGAGLIPVVDMDDAAAARGYDVENGVAIIPVVDVLTKHRTFFSYLFGGSSMRDIAKAFENALEDPGVHSIVLLIDSPGGTVDGTEETASRIREGRGKKPIVALADGMMASAAYWIGSAADKVYIAGETVEVGSIGVVATHIDVSKADEKWGEKWTEITAGKYKRIASAHKPLSDEGRAYIQEGVDEIYRIFVDAVASNRGRSVDLMLEAADGRLYIGRQAMQAGLVDDVLTLDQLIVKLEEEHKMTLDELKTKHANLYEEAVTVGRIAEREATSKAADTARQEGFSAGKAEGLKEGAEAERKRIQGIEAVAAPGYESVIAAAKFDGKTTAGEAAILITKKLQEDHANTLAELKRDGIPPVSQPAAQDMASQNSQADDDTPIETKAKAAWEKSKSLQEEFSGNYDAFLAFEKNVAAGRIKIFRRDK